MTVGDARRYIEVGHFAAGSMLPRMKAIVWFLEEGGQEAIITKPENVARALKGETGARVRP